MLHQSETEGLRQSCSGQLSQCSKGIGNLRRLHGVEEAIRRCTCTSHQNVDYLSCHTSLASFISAVSCSATEHPTLSSLSKLPISIKEQEKNNVIASEEKEKKRKKNSGDSVNRNVQREGPAKQKKDIKLVSWGGSFTFNEKRCAYQECPSCGVLKFFDASNMCDAERNPNFQVSVRKYENIPGRSRGMQLEIVEVSMNGAELI